MNFKSAIIHEFCTHVKNHKSQHCANGIAVSLASKNILLVECWQRFVKALLAVQPVGHLQTLALHTSPTDNTLFS